MDELTEQLRANSTLSIQIGTGNPPISISKAVLANVSPGLDRLVQTADVIFDTEVDHNHELSLPKDNYGAWKALLYWIIKKYLPDEVKASEALLVSTWALGEKYEIIELQDEAMMSLLLLCDGHDIHNSTIESAFALTLPGSRLRRLMAGEVFNKLKNTDSKSATLELPGVEGVDITSGNNPVGMVTELLNAKRRYELHGDGFWERFAERDDHRFGRWKQFMVGNGMAVRGRAAKREREEDHGESEFSSEESD